MQASLGKSSLMAPFQGVRPVRRASCDRPSASFLDLPVELVLHVLAFCDPASIASMASCSRMAHELAVDPLLWLPQCLEAWSLPASTPASRVLASLTPSYPLHRIFPYITEWPEELEVRERPSGSNPFELGALDPHTVRLISNHGQNRAVRSTTPFPDLPRDHDSEEETVWNRLARLFGCKSRIPPMLARLAAASAPAAPALGPSVASAPAVPCQSPQPQQPPQQRKVKAFSAPWLRADGSLDVAPRSVAYYEVTICPTDAPTPYSGCVAVGLGLEEFPLEGFMPGWDSTSFAYHSDDGGIFHGTGIKVRYYGPRFGPTDVVGCGLDYTTHEIFFTLNGRYLGVAFEGVHGALYPTVGIDAVNPLTINFGEQPFVFDLADYMTQQPSQPAAIVEVVAAQEEEPMILM